MTTKKLISRSRKRNCQEGTHALFELENGRGKNNREIYDTPPHKSTCHGNFNLEILKKHIASSLPTNQGTPQKSNLVKEALVKQ